MGSFISKQAFYPPQNGELLLEDYPEVKTVTNKNGDLVPYIHYKRTQKNYPFTLVYCHGNAEDIIGSDYFMSQLSRKLQMDIVHFDYPGYSFSVDKKGNPIEPREHLCYENMEAVCNLLENDWKIAPENILFLGKSLGSGVAVEAIRRHPNYGGLILLCPLMSAIRVVRRTSFTWPFDIFCNIDKVNAIKVPSIVVHGMQDDVIDVSHGQKLFELLGSELKRSLWIEEADHNNIESTHCREYYTHLKAFLNLILETRGL